MWSALYLSLLQIINPSGTQVVDTWAFNAKDLKVGKLGHFDSVTLASYREAQSPALVQETLPPSLNLLRNWNLACATVSRVDISQDKTLLKPVKLSWGNKKIENAHHSFSRR